MTLRDMSMSDKVKVNIIGHLAQKPETRIKQETGKQYVTFRVGINSYDYKWKETKTMYMSCVAGERYLNYLLGAEKGDKVVVEGKLSPDSYVDKDGVKHEVYNVLVDDIDITRKPTGGAPASAGQARSQQQRPQAPTGQQQYQNGQSQYQRQPQQIQPQQQNGYFYECNPFEDQTQGEGFRPATYSY